MTRQDKRRLAISLTAGLAAAILAWGIIGAIQSDRLLAALGLGRPARYLVLAQNPAELRPAGGYTGTVGVIALNNGRLTERSFDDVYFYDLRPDIPFVEPPEELANHLLGANSWHLADAAWSPDFPTSAQNALRQYTLESGDADIDGVIALTTFAVDRLLEVTGPIEVPEYGVTVAPGEVTMTALSLTRGVSTPTSDRKAFLEVLANRTLERLFSLPMTDLPRLVDAISTMSTSRDVLVWLKDPRLQAVVASTPASGAVRQDPGDYLFVVEANVSPTSKYNLVVERSDTLDVEIDPDGNATSDLTLTWQNNAMQPGEPYASLREYSKSKVGQYGAFVRVLTPMPSTLTAADGSATSEVDGAELVTAEAGRNVFGNYLLMNPGSSSLHYAWSAPGVATNQAGRWTYQLTVQKQAGVPRVQTAVTVSLPVGAIVESLSTGATAADSIVSMSSELDKDVQLQVTYRLP